MKKNDQELMQQAARREITAKQAAQAMQQRDGDGLMGARLAGLTTMLCLGGTAGSAIEFIHWYVWFALALGAGGWSILSLLNAPDPFDDDLGGED